jgi:hypothetical protein
MATIVLGHGMDNQRETPDLIEAAWLSAPAGNGLWQAGRAVLDADANAPGRGRTRRVERGELRTDDEKPALHHGDGPLRCGKRMIRRDRFYHGGMHVARPSSEEGARDLIVADLVS